MSDEDDTRAMAPNEVDLARTRPSSPHALRTIEGPLAAGSLLAGNYRVMRALGEGGMGFVVLARDEQLQREVAIKLIRPELLTLSNARERFLTEARTMARLQHPNVIGIYSVGEVSGVPYLVMEYVPGESLRTFIDRRKGAPLGVDESLGILDQVCRGLSAIHAAGIVHRDLKPGNVLIGAAFRVAIGDLGLARMLVDLSRGTDRQYVSGTPAYMAPEVILQTGVSAELAPRADIFSLGVLSYQLLTGQLPFGRRLAISLEDGDTPRVLVPASQVNPLLPEEVDDVLAGALSRFVESRTASADVFRRALLGAVHQNMKLADCPSRVLVADDDENYLDLMRMVLARAFPGSVIECVGDGTTALEAAELLTPDLVVTDLDMPGLNGVELTAAIRQLPKLREVPIIVATAVGGPTDWRLLSRIGADGFLGKPFEPTQLVALARGVLDGHRRRSTPVPRPP